MIHLNVDMRTVLGILFGGKIIYYGPRHDGLGNFQGIPSGFELPMFACKNHIKTSTLRQITIKTLKGCQINSPGCSPGNKRLSPPSAEQRELFERRNQQRR